MKTAVAIDRADAIGVAVEREARVILAVDYGAPQSFHVRLDRLRIDAAEKRVARPADFIARNSVARETIRGASPRPAPCIGSTTKRKFAARILSQSTSLSSVSRYGVRTSSD